MGALLIVSLRTIQYAVSQYSPCLFYGIILVTISGCEILFHPFPFTYLFRAPWQFSHQFKHHRIIFNAFHGKSDAFKMLRQRVIPCFVEVVQQLIQTAVQSHISTEILEQAEEPVVLLVSAFPVPQRWLHSPHGAAFAE
ncbi:hypothetical protein SDC9_104504 [bioreactor metagenome]|uniref:Uncharacterized protein n=1 Tax=bioreactor metagenome TaxID=1076179 RepID=A0A645AZF0_9ZZZZ